MQQNLKYYPLTGNPFISRVLSVKPAASPGFYKSSDNILTTLAPGEFAFAQPTSFGFADTNECVLVIHPFNNSGVYEGNTLFEGDAKKARIFVNIAGANEVGQYFNLTNFMSGGLDNTQFWYGLSPTFYPIEGTTQPITTAMFDWAIPSTTNSNILFIKESHPTANVQFQFMLSPFSENVERILTPASFTRTLVENVQNPTNGQFSFASSGTVGLYLNLSDANGNSDSDKIQNEASESVITITHTSGKYVKITMKTDSKDIAHNLFRGYYPTVMYDSSNPTNAPVPITVSGANDFITFMGANYGDTFTFQFEGLNPDFFDIGNDGKEGPIGPIGPSGNHGKSGGGVTTIISVILASIAIVLFVLVVIYLFTKHN